VNRLFSRTDPAVCWLLLALLSLALSSIALTSSSTRAQSTPDESLDEEAVPGQGRRYAWGEGGEQGGGGSEAATHRFSQIFGAVGAGTSIRLYYDPDVLRQDFLAPAYLQLRLGYFFEGDGDLQHGVGLGIATNLQIDPPDPSVADGFLEAGQWTLAPSYFLRVWISDAFQILGSFGVPIGLSGTYQTFGLELAGGVIYEFLAGFGIYAHITFSTYFASFVQPLVSGDLGLVFDYEVLP